MKKGVKNTGKYADVPARLKSWGYIVVVFAIMLLHKIPMSAITVSLSLYALREYFTMASVRSPVLLYTAYTIAVPVFISMYTNDYRLFVLTIAVYIVVLLIINTLFTKTEVRNMGIVAGIVLCIFSIGHLAFIRALNDPHGHISGVKLVLYLVLLAEFNDVFQYLSGKTFGRRKIVPRISPNKTVEGFIGGIVLTVLLSNVAGRFLFPQKNVLFYTIAGIAIAVAGFGGDVLMSAIKRKNRVKDTGSLIPGHGGLLDRMDSLLLILPVFYWSLLLISNNDV